MMKRPTMTAIALAAALGVACGEPARDPTGVAPSFDRGSDGGRRAKWSAWSEPMNLGPPINSAASEAQPTLSPDELSLYFGSDRAGGHGGTDLWVSRRTSLRSAWGAPVNLGPVINTSGVETGPSLSSDGHLLFFRTTHGSHPGGQGGTDIYVSRRANPKNDFAWEAPVNLGPHVNTAADEAGPGYVPGARHASLYFNRRSAPVATADFDLYSVPLTRNGLPKEPAKPISELNTPANEQAPEVSTDGRELLITSDRPGTLGGNDIWRSTRRSVRDPWSTPENLGTPINTAFTDAQTNLSGDGRTLIFASNRPGGFGLSDLWMSTRTLIGDDDDDDSDDDDGDDGDDG